MEWLSIECGKTSWQGQGANENANGKNMQTEREETRVNETREVLIFACNWLREWREFSGPITERSEAKPSNPELLSTLNWKFLQPERI